MATPEKIENNAEIPTELTKSKEDFSTELTVRISISKELLAKPVSTALELSILSRQYTNWNECNSELLQQLFDKADNEYAYSYNQIGHLDQIKLLSMMKERPTPSGRRQMLRQKISEKINNLEQLFEKLKS